MVALPHQLNLLATYLTHGLDGLLAAQPPVPTNDLLNWFADPATQSTINTLKLLAQAAADLRHSRARFNAIATLDEVCTTSPDPTERRLAATKILSPNRKDQPPTPQSSDSPSQREGAGGWVPPTPDSQQPGLNTSDSLDLTTPLTHGELTTEPAATPSEAFLDLTPNAQRPAAPTPDDATNDESDADLDLDLDLNDDGIDQDAADDADLDAHSARIERHLGVRITHPDVLHAIAELAQGFLNGTLDPSTHGIPDETVEAADRLDVHPRMLFALEHLAADIRARSPNPSASAQTSPPPSRTTTPAPPPYTPSRRT